MFVVGNFLEAIATILNTLLEILWWLVIIRALLSWVNPDPSNPIVRFIERSTEWLLAPFRQLIPTYRIGIDVSPIVVFLFLYFLQLFFIPTLMGIAYRLK